MPVPMFRTRASRRLAPRRAAIAAGALLALAASADAQWGELPPRQPKKGVKHRIVIDVPWSTLGYADDRRETFEGRVALYPPDENDERTFRVVADMFLTDGRGAEVPVKETILHLDKSGDPVDASEDLSDGLPRDARYRLFADSDFALVPARMMFRHEMPSGSGGTADKTRSSDEYRVSWSERFLGVETVSRTPLQKFECRVVRTHVPSGWQLLDYVLTFEDERDDTVLAAFAVRMLVHLDRPLPDGRAAPNGVHHIALLKSYQLDWRQQREVIGDDEWAPRLERWFSRLSDQLFFSLDVEGVGDPNESPSAFALRALHVFDARSLGRLTSAGSPKALAAVAPQLLDAPLAYDPAPFVDAYGKVADPHLRLALAAAAAAAGRPPAGADREARVGLRSRDPSVRRDAATLARALGDAALVEALTRATRDDPEEEVRVRALLALGAIGGGAARDALSAALDAATTDRMRAAASRGLADTGDEAAAPDLAGPQVRFGATSPETGLFEVVIEDPEAAATALAELFRLARAARAGDRADVLSRLEDSLRYERSDQPGKIAVSDSAREWMVRLGGLVPELIDDVTDPDRRAVARRVAAASGRAAIDPLVAMLRASKSKQEKTRVAVLLGYTRDPRARDVLMKMSDSDDLEDFEAASEGLRVMESDPR